MWNLHVFIGLELWTYRPFVKWDFYLLKPTLGPPKKFQCLTRTEEVVITRLRIGHTKATKSHILSRGPPTTCHHCGQMLQTIDHMLLECAALQDIRDEYYTADSLETLCEKIPETCIVDSSIWYELSKVINCKWPYLCRTTNMSCRTCVVVKQIQSNPDHLIWNDNATYLTEWKAIKLHLQSWRIHFVNDLSSPWDTPFI